MISEKVYDRLLGKCLGCGGEVPIVQKRGEDSLGPPTILVSRMADAYVLNITKSNELYSVGERAGLQNLGDFRVSLVRSEPGGGGSEYALHSKCAIPVIEAGKRGEYILHGVNIDGKERVLEGKFEVDYPDFRKTFTYFCDQYGLPVIADATIGLRLTQPTEFFHPALSGWWDGVG